MLGRLATFTFHRRRLVLLLSGLAVAVMGILAPQAFGALKTGGFSDPHSGSAQAHAVLERDFGGQPNLVLLVTPTHGRSLDSPAVADAATGLETRLRARPDVSSITSYWSTHAAATRAANGQSGLLALNVRGSDAAAATSATDIIAASAKATGPITVRAGGPLGVNADVATAVSTSLARAEAVAIPLTLLLLVVVFGNLIAALLPLAIGMIAVLGTFAELAIMGRLTDVSVYAVNLTTALSLGLAVDYSLLMVNRFREEIRGGSDVETALRATTSTAGRTIVFSSATVAAALSALLVFPLYFLKSFAYAGIGVVVIAMVGALTLLPALLATFGTRLARQGRRADRSSSDSGFWRRTATVVTRHPLVIGVPIVAALLTVAAPLSHLHVGNPDDRVLRTTATSRQVGDLLRTRYPDSAASALEVVLTGRANSPVTASDAAGERQRIASLPEVTAVGTPIMRSGTALLTVSGPADSTSPSAQHLVRTIRTLPAPSGTDVLVGGPTAELVDSTAAVTSSLPWTMAWVALTTFVLLFLFTGSVVLPLKALLLNVLSLSAVFGALVWTFQDGHLASALSITPAPLNTAMLVLVFCIAFGLSMDYEVFLLSRIKESRERGSANADAVVNGLASTGRIVTTAGALLSITFLAFGSADVSFLQMFGIGAGIAIVLDATVIRGLLVPALMRLAGEANWWAPAPLRRLQRHISLHDG